MTYSNGLPIVTHFSEIWQNIGKGVKTNKNFTIFQHSYVSRVSRYQISSKLSKKKYALEFLD